MNLIELETRLTTTPAWRHKTLSWKPGCTKPGRSHGSPSTSFHAWSPTS